LERLMFYALRTVFLSAFLMAMVLLLPGQQAAAGGPPVLNSAFGSNTGNANSWVAGGHAGYNWQQGAVVYGFETDFQGTHLDSSMRGGLMYNPPMAPPAGDFASTMAAIDHYGTFRGRLGWTTGQWMFYGTGARLMAMSI
jgi:hypothetical protein